MQSTGTRPISHGVSRKPTTAQLIQRQNTLLGLSQARNQRVGPPSVDFVGSGALFSTLGAGAAAWHARIVVGDPSRV
jgi:hypothetical protein